MRFQVRIHGRGGQGVVTAAEILSVAAFLEGKYAQAFPSFGPERSGAPVASFCRISDARIRTHEPVAEPDAVVVQDATLLHSLDVFGGLRPLGFVLLNTRRSLDELGLADLVARLPASHVRAVDATALAQRHLGKPLPNIAMLGALAALTGAVGVEALAKAVVTRFQGRAGEANTAVARDAFREAGGPC